MKKFFVVMAISSLSILPFSNNANAELTLPNEINPKPTEELTRCKVIDRERGFIARGNCDKVLAAYKRFRKIYDGKLG